MEVNLVSDIVRKTFDRLYFIPLRIKGGYFAGLWK